MIEKTLWVRLIVILVKFEAKQNTEANLIRSQDHISLKGEVSMVT